MKKRKMIHFRNKSGRLIYSLPADMTIEQWVKAGLPEFHLVAKGTPWKRGEVRARP